MAESPIVLNRVCAKCGVSKPATLEFFNAAKPGLLRKKCKPCWKQDRAKPRKPLVRKCRRCDEVFAVNSNSQYFCSKTCCLRERNERLFDGRMRWRRENKERILERKRARYSEAHEHYTAYRKAYRENNRELYNESARQYRLRNLAEVSARVEKWWADNPHRARELRADRRARERGAKGSFDAKAFDTLCHKREWRCFYCSNVIPPDGMTADHMMPLVKGGSNHMTNIVPACRSCNSAKYTKTAGEFLAQIGRLT